MKRDAPRDILPPGSVFEKYTVYKRLGSGGMGAVYPVRHNLLDTLFALKILHPDVARQDSRFVSRFIREAKLAGAVRHPNLIEVHDAGRNAATGIYYIVMDYVSGGSLRILLSKTDKLGLAESLQIITGIAHALNAAHHAGIVHRDIKPENIMFDAGGTAKLADLGIAKVSEPSGSALTVTSAVFGTPAYMSPEQAMDSGKVDCRTDIYSLGIVFFEMLAGRLPFNGSTPIELLSQLHRPSRKSSRQRNKCSFRSPIRSSFSHRLISVRDFCLNSSKRMPANRFSSPKSNPRGDSGIKSGSSCHAVRIW